MAFRQTVRLSTTGNGEPGFFTNFICVIPLGGRKFHSVKDVENYTDALGFEFEHHDDEDNEIMEDYDMFHKSYSKWGK